MQFKDVTPEEFISNFKSPEDFKAYLEIAVFTAEDLADVMEYCVAIEKYEFCEVIKNFLSEQG